MKLRVSPAGQPLSGHYTPPGDKSISHRLAILGGLAPGQTRISGYLDSADTRATLAAMQALGAQVETGEAGLTIRGGELRAPVDALDLGNSGTGLRLLCGALAGHPALLGSKLVLTGDRSLMARPMMRIAEPLVAMGAGIGLDAGHGPVELTPARLKGRRYTPPMASAQVKSAVLLAGLNAEGETVVVEPGPSRDHTERLLPAFGVRLHDGEPGIGLSGGQAMRAGGDFHVPGDPSSAAFALVAGLLVEGSAITLENVGLNPTRDGLFRILDAMGAELSIQAGEPVGAEPVGRLSVRSTRLEGIEVPVSWVPLAIDEFPLLMALAAAVSGTTCIRGAEELRVKESDRIAVMCRELARLGVSVEERADGAIIHGGTVRGGRVDSAGDHRVAMSLAVLGLVAEAPVEIDNAHWIETSYPGFVDDLRSLGAELAWLED